VCAEGLSVAAIPERLNEEGFRPPKCVDRFNRGMVQRLLSRAPRGRLWWSVSHRDGPPHRALGGHYGWQIERLFSIVKEAQWSAAARTVDVLIAAMGDALRAVRPRDILGWFGHSGYRPPASTGTPKRKPL
jgi:hypothetical protein